MTKRNLIIAFIFFVIALLFWWRMGEVNDLNKTKGRKQETQFEQQEGGGEKSKRNSNLVERESKEAFEKRLNNYQEKMNELETKAKKREIDRETLMKKMTEALNEPIVLYGKVEDQHGEAIEGVEVVGKVTVAVDFMRSGKAKMSAKTDQNGLFHIEGEKGCSLGVGFIKEGYQYNSNSSGFKYSLDYPEKTHHPDPANPVVFTMWKMKGAEDLVVGDNFFGIKPDGSPFTLNLIKGKKMAGAGEGDLQVRIQRPEQIDPSGKFSWNCSIDGIVGGIVVSDGKSIYNNEAPVSGYQSHYEIQMNENNANWKRELDLKFYLSSRKGQVYGWLEVEIIPDYNKNAVFSIKYLLNPNGSRNLEYDPKKELKWDEDQNKLVPKFPWLTSH